MTSLKKLYDYAQQGDIRVFSENIGFAQAVTIKDGTSFNIALDKSLIGSELKEKNVLMHELAHIATGSFYRVSSDIHYKRKMENKANKWLIKLMVPKNDFDQAIEDGFTQVWELAELFEVTEEFMEKVIFYYQNGYMQ